MDLKSNLDLTGFRNLSGLAEAFYWQKKSGGPSTGYKIMSATSGNTLLSHKHPPEVLGTLCNVTITCLQFWEHFVRLQTLT
jgi:hypothetical protein